MTSPSYPDTRQPGDPATRRDFVRALLGGAAGATLVSRGLFAQATAAAPITVNKLSDRFAVLSGNGGNIGLLIGAEGLMMIDGGLANRAADLAKAIAEVDGRRVQVLFNTHYHFDHVGSNELLGGKTGTPPVRIIAHQAVRARLSTRMVNEAFGRTFEPLTAAGQPTETFMNSGRLEFGDNRVDYSHVPPSHTDGDAFVWMEGENVLHAGDLFWAGRYPVIDYSAGGSLAAMATALDTIDRVVDDTTRIVPGHGPVSSRADLRMIRDAWAEINSRLQDLAKAGRTVDEALAAAPTKEYDATFGTASRDGFLRQAYGGILAKP